MFNENAMSVAVQVYKNGLKITDKYYNVFAVSIENDMLIIEMLDEDKFSKVKILTDIILKLEVRNNGFF